MPAGEHQHQKTASVRCAIVTVSDTRTEANDVAGALIRDLLTGAGHDVSRTSIVPDEPQKVRDLLIGERDDATCDAILMTGGTGLSPRDNTPEVVAELLDKRLDGFGELFRSLSFGEIGAAAMLSRAVAGVMGSTVVFSMPGSPAAVRLAMEKLIIPELGHIAYLLAARH